MPYAFGLFVIALQVITIIHIVRTGRAQMWMMVVLFLPMVGSIAYFIAELLPDLMGSSGVRSAANRVHEWADPGRNYRRLHEDARLTDSAQTKRDLAAECMDKERYGEAIEHLKAAMVGIHADDPALGLMLAEAQVGCGDFTAANLTLTSLVASDPAYHREERLLLLARAAEGLGEAATAEQNYKNAILNFPGPEAKHRYAHFLWNQNRFGESKELLEQILAEAKRQPPHARRLNKYWLDQTRDALKSFG